MSRGSGAGWDHISGTVWDTDDRDAPTDEEILEVMAEMQLDILRNDPILAAAFDHGDFGDDIMEAGFDTFADIKTYVADTIFATDDSSNSNTADDYEYEASGEDLEVVDVSDYFEFGNWTPPKMYAEPARIEMPSILQQYNTYEPPEGALELLDHTHEDYPVDYSESGFIQEPGNKSDVPYERTSKVDPEWRGKRRTKRNIKEIVGKDQDWEKWTEAAGVGNPNSPNDSDKVKTFYRENRDTLDFPA